MQRNTQEQIELMDNAILKNLAEAMEKEDTISASLHRPFSEITADKPVKHILESGEIKEMPSGAKYRVDENGCWHKV